MTNMVGMTTIMTMASESAPFMKSSLIPFSR
jgi:hypothetical protein